MQVTVADAGTLRKQITIVYDQDEVAAREDQLLGRYAQGANMKGFRKGKTPKALLKKRWGEAVTNEAREALLQEAMRSAFEEHGLQPIGPFANDELDTEGGLKQVTSFDIRPEVSLPDASSLSVSVEEAVASDEEIQEELDALANRSGEHVDLGDDTELAKDDVVKLTGKIASGEETVREVHDLNHIVGAYPLFGKEPAEVSELVATLKVGGTLAFDTTLPENFKPEEWAGKDAKVEVTIQSAQRMQPAELDDEFAKKLGAESLDELKERITGFIAQRKEDAVHSKQVDELTEALIGATSFELPPALFEAVVKDNLDAAVNQAKQESAEADEAAVRSEKEAEVTERVEKDIRRLLILDAIADAENVQATQEDLQQQIAMAAYQTGQKPEDLAKNLQESGRLMEVANDIRQHKALELMLQKVLEANGAGETEAAEEAAAAD